MKWGSSLTLRRALGPPPLWRPERPPQAEGLPNRSGSGPRQLRRVFVYFANPLRDLVHALAV